MLGCRDGETASLFFGLVRCPDGTVRVEDMPCIPDGGAGCNDAVGEGEGDHVEVTKGDDQVPTVSGTADQFGDVPCLGGSVTEIRVIRLAFIGSMSLSYQGFSYAKTEKACLGWILPLTCVLKTSIMSFLPGPYLTLAVATPFPTYQSPLQKAVGRPFSL